MAQQRKIHRQVNECINPVFFTCCKENMADISFALNIEVRETVISNFKSVASPTHKRFID